MRTWEYIEPNPDGSAATYRRTEAEILAEYWPFWHRRALEYVKKHGNLRGEITRERCIEDWVTINWAVEVKE